MSTAKWTDERTQILIDATATESPVSADTVEVLASKLEVTARSVASKLRKMGIEVASMAKAATSTFTEGEASELGDFVQRNEGKYTYTEIAQHFKNGAFTPKQIQGKLLSMELTSCVKPAEKVEAQRTYTEAEEATFISMCNKGAFVEDLSAKLNKSVNSIRGKALSLLRSGDIDKIPAQKESHAKEVGDVFENIDVSSKSLAELIEITGKTERGIKTTLTRRGIACANYDGAAKKAKNEAKAAN